MKKITIKHRETGEQVEAFLDAEGTIYLVNGRVADFNEWGYDPETNIRGGLAIFAIAALVVYVFASSIVYFTASDERKFMRDCLQTANEHECHAQWLVMQRDKNGTTN